MAAITSENASMWQALANMLEGERPSVGKPVYVQGGRKHKGKFGTVVRHQRDQFSHAYRYGNDASHHMKDMAGTYGWACLVECGTERFWIRADYLTIACPVDIRGAR